MTGSWNGDPSSTCGLTLGTVTTGGAFSTVIVTESVPESPSSSVTVTVAVYVPLSKYVCVGFCSFDVCPSPKLQE